MTPTKQLAARFAKLRRSAAVESYWTDDVRQKMLRLVGLALFEINIAELPDIKPETTRTSPIILPHEYTGTLMRARGLTP
jgi:hypothetical protein